MRVCVCPCIFRQRKRVKIPWIIYKAMRCAGERLLSKSFSSCTMRMPFPPPPASTIHTTLATSWNRRTIQCKITQKNIKKSHFLLHFAKPRPPCGAWPSPKSQVPCHINQLSRSPPSEALIITGKPMFWIASLACSTVLTVPLRKMSCNFLAKQFSTCRVESNQVETIKSLHIYIYIYT